MDDRLKKMMGGLSTASLILAGSIPLMGAEDPKPKVDAEKAKTVQSQAAAEKSKNAKASVVPGKPNLKDNVGKNDCKGKGECRTDGKTAVVKKDVKNATKDVKDNVGKGGKVEVNGQAADFKDGRTKALERLHALNPVAAPGTIDGLIYLRPQITPYAHLMVQPEIVVQALILGAWVARWMVPGQGAQASKLNSPEA